MKIVLICGLLVAGNIFADGARVGGSKPNPRGGLLLKDATDITLISEDLTISALDNISRYTVHAVYKLENKGNIKNVLVGVPFSWEEDSVTPDNGSNPTIEQLMESTEPGQKNLARKATEVQISIDGKTYPCVPPKDKDKDQFPTSADESSTLTKYDIKGWCVSKIKIPINSPFTIDLQYASSYLYVDAMFSKNALAIFAPRKFSFLLFPLGFWSEPIKELNINLDFGVLTRYADVNSPAKSKRRHGKILWHLKNANPQDFSDINIDISPVFYVKGELRTWNKRAELEELYGKVNYRVSASSSLGIHTPQMVLDGDPATAWCADAPGHGEGEWLQFEGIKAKKKVFDELKKQWVITNEELKSVVGFDSCRAEGLMITNGFVKTQGIYTRNPTIRQIGIAKCDTNDYKIIDLEPVDSYLKAVQLIPINRTESSGFKEYDFPVDCFKLKLIKIDPPKIANKNPDICISEVAIVVNCD